jgi:threonylcarbamoyladenosine tRNA methylthiotransferase MtaB
VKVYLRTFGCRANHYDTEAVRALLEASGQTIVDDPSEADAAIFNSCAVTTDAEAEVRKAVRRAAKRQPSLRTVVMGCASALDGSRRDELSVRALPTVQGVVAGADLAAIASALELGVDATVLGSFVTHQQAGTRALLRIQDGCDEHCTFCATTLARGANRSRAPELLVREAALLAERHAEIVITGIHIGTYGADIGTTLGALMERLVREVPAVRFRLSSIEATELDERLVELLVGEPLRVAPHVHAPLQSGSDRLLKRMGRHWYSGASYAAALGSLAARMPVLGLGADVITGFPGESAADHADTTTLIRELPFTYLHVFPYSARAGTAAVRLPDPVPQHVANERAAELRAISAANAAAYAAQRSGGEADVVVIGDGAKKHGLTGDYLTVELADEQVARGTRFRGRLGWREGLVVSACVDPDQACVRSSKGSCGHRSAWRGPVDR